MKDEPRRSMERAVPILPADDLEAAKRSAAMMNRGLTRLEEPGLAIPWGILPHQLRRLFRESGHEARLRFVTEGYFTLPCRALGGLETQLGLHFHPRSEKGRLAELEFFDNGQRDLSASYALYQQHLERVFGRPWRSRPGLFAPDLKTHDWLRRGLWVSHRVVERFGPEEHVRVTRLPWFLGWLRQGVW